MSRKQKLIDLKRKKIENIDKMASSVKELTELMGPAQELKRDTETDISFLEVAPDDLIEEHADRLILLEEGEVEKLGYASQALEDATRNMFIGISSTSGSGSAIVDLAYSTRRIPRTFSPAMREVITQYETIAEDKARNSDLPKKLNKINYRLGDRYIEAMKNVELGRAQIINVNKAMVDMRAVLDQLWGGMVAEYRRRNIGVRGSEQGKEITKPSHRDEIAEALSTDTQTKQSWVLLLESISQLQKELSDTEQLKNPLNVDVAKLNEFYSRWITQLNDTVNLLTALGMV
jgi:hypothetical protein